MKAKDRESGWYKVKDGEWRIAQWSQGQGVWYIDSFRFTDKDLQKIGPRVMKLDGTLITEKAK